jgi:histidinol phosphatase-like PHP family hydrolase
MSIDDVLAQPVGARFHRADLHIHSFSASHDVRDATMTSEGIVSTALREGLSMIAITDHNEIGNVEGSCREVGGNWAARLRGHGVVDQAARSRSAGERSRVGQPSTRRMVI